MRRCTSSARASPAISVIGQPAGTRAALARLLNPVCTVLNWMHAAPVPRNAVVYIFVAEMHHHDVA